MSKLVEFKNKNLAKLEANWSKVENKEDYQPSYNTGYDSGFTHFVASEFCNHNSQNGDYDNV